MSRVQGTRGAKPQTMVSLAELVSDVASESTASAQTQGVRLEVDLPDDDRLAVLGSSDDLAQALTNLTTNAIRHTDPGLVVRARGQQTATFESLLSTAVAGYRRRASLESSTRAG
ncbi:MAG TPA: hypothetical protein VJW23_14575, partial [Propionibacteriaceae bacterium]|nr:hypothetical protein [Propionibacteriaceae bacterium]